jgi:drug/metabolite transporter (DMT)-like permease
MVGAGAALAGMQAIVRLLSADIHPIQLAFFRSLVGLLVLMPWLLTGDRGRFRTQRFGAHFVRALFGGSAMLCLFVSLSLMPLADVTALTYTAPLFATAGAALILGEQVRLRRWTATTVGLLGALVIIRPGTSDLSWGVVTALAAAAFMAGAALSIKSLSRTERADTIVFYFGSLATLLSLIPALFVWRWPAVDAWLWLGLIGISATAGQMLLTRAFAAAEASAVLPFDFSRLIVVSVIAAFAFNELPDLWTYIGAGIILSAAVYIAHRETRIGSETPPQPS